MLEDVVKTNATSMNMPATGSLLNRVEVSPTEALNPNCYYEHYVDDNGQMLTYCYDNEWIRLYHNESKIYRLHCETESLSNNLMQELESKGHTNCRENEYALRFYNGDVNQASCALTLTALF
jgi:hypothetical protein